MWERFSTGATFSSTVLSNSCCSFRNTRNTVSRVDPSIVLTNLPPRPRSPPGPAPADGFDPSIINTKLCVLEHMGSIGKHILDEIQKKFANPVLSVLYPDVCNPAPLPATDFRFGFAIGYAAQDDVEQRLGSRNISRTGLDYHICCNKVKRFTTW